MKKAILLTLMTLFVLTVLADPISPKLAGVSSLAIPGTGQFLNGQKGKSAMFITAEVLGIMTMIRFQHEEKWMESSYKDFAHHNAGAQANGSTEYYDQVRNYYSSDDYNERVYLYGRNQYLISPYDVESYNAFVEQYLVDQDKAWSWNSQKNWKRFKDMRVQKQDYHMYAQLAVGAIMVNHIVSMIEAASTATKIKRDYQQYGMLTCQPDWRKKGVKIEYTYRF